MKDLHVLLLSAVLTSGVGCSRTSEELGSRQQAVDSEEVDIVVIITDKNIPADVTVQVNDLKLKVGTKVFKHNSSIVGPSAGTSVEAPDGKKYIVQDTNKIALGVRGIARNKIDVEGSYEKKGTKKVYQLRIFKKPDEKQEAPLAGGDCPEIAEIEVAQVSCAAGLKDSCLADVTCDEEN